MINKKCITDFDLKSKRVIIRVDFNVPIKDDRILDDNRIKAALETIKYAYTNGAKVILLSHLGRVTSEEDKKDNSLRIVAIRLSELLFKPVLFIDECVSDKVDAAINEMQDGDIVLLENTRFTDVPEPRESKNDLKLAEYWASLGDIFIDDAFALAHRAHASNVGIAKLLPNGIGFLIKKEVEGLESVLSNPKKPYTLVLGGAKVKDKIGVINNLIDQVDYLIIGGAMAYTFLKAKGVNVGLSIVDEDHLTYAKELLQKYSDKIILPIDVIVGDSKGTKCYSKKIDDIASFEIGYDIGPLTIELFDTYIKKSNTALVNGPMGLFEEKAYSKGTDEILKSLVNVSDVIICGGDTAGAALSMGYNEYKLISTGGGASLEMLAGNEMPGIDVIDEK